MRYGVFGGTFDPPHIGHLILAAEAQDQFELDRVLWVLTPEPPHKSGRMITDVGVRLEMLRAAIGDDPGFELSRVDIDRPPPHYARDTMAALREEHPGGEFIYLMGGDSLGDLPAWHEPRRFLELCDGLAVMYRPGEPVDLQALETQLPGVSEKVSLLQAPLLEISSSEIRRRVGHGLPYRYYLPKRVYWIIHTAGLYKR
jgi:nicotinate-nucleotide adenylyltransferase